MGSIRDNGYRTFKNREFCECDSEGVRRCSPLPITNKAIKGVVLCNSVFYHQTPMSSLT